jgi:ribonucleoside-triphosphate reductase
MEKQMIKSYKLFTTPSCPNCPAVKEYMKTIKIKGEEIDASSDKGRNEAINLGIMSVPTIVFFDENGNEVKRANSIRELNKIFK